MTNQLIVVAVDECAATFSFLNRDNLRNLKKIINTYAFIGKNGLGKTKEGDMKTPTGTYKIIKAFGIEDNPGTSLPYIKVDETYYWVDDSHSKYYNQFVNINEVEKDWNSAERIIDEGIAYKYALALDYNANGEKQRGSAIFIHVSKGIPTAGCIAIPEDDMIKLMKKIKEGCKVIIDYSSNISDYLDEGD